MTDTVDDAADVEEIRETLEDIVRLLVDSPDDVAVGISGSVGTVLFTVKVNPDDTGKVIGKGGRIADSLRNLIASACGRLNKRAYVEIPAKSREEMVKP
jgi:predicted RNA-binding protein YlqC (UPF0109 family)